MGKIELYKKAKEENGRIRILAEREVRLRKIIEETFTVKLLSLPEEWKCDYMVEDSRKRLIAIATLVFLDNADDYIPVPSQKWLAGNIWAEHTGIAGTDKPTEHLIFFSLPRKHFYYKHVKAKSDRLKVRRSTELDDYVVMIPLCFFKEITTNE